MQLSKVTSNAAASAALQNAAAKKVKARQMKNRTSQNEVASRARRRASIAEGVSPFSRDRDTSELQKLAEEHQALMAEQRQLMQERNAELAQARDRLNDAVGCLERANKIAAKKSGKVSGSTTKEELKLTLSDRGDSDLDTEFASNSLDDKYFGELLEVAASLTNDTP